MALPNIGQLASAGPDEILRPVRPWFIVATVALAFVGNMVSGVLPVVGVPLPLVSYGGTALISLFIGLGLLMSVQAHRKLVNT